MGLGRRRRHVKSFIFFLLMSAKWEETKKKTKAQRNIRDQVHVPAEKISPLFHFYSILFPYAYFLFRNKL